MADRRVTQSGKDRDGDITALCGVWGRALKATAIREIDDRVHRYFVRLSGGADVDVVVVNGRSGRYLRTDPDRTSRNNLDDLPDC